LKWSLLRFKFPLLFAGYLYIPFIRKTYYYPARCSEYHLAG